MKRRAFIKLTSLVCGVFGIKVNLGKPPADALYQILTVRWDAFHSQHAYFVRFVPKRLAHNCYGIDPAIERPFDVCRFPQPFEPGDYVASERSASGEHVYYRCGNGPVPPQFAARYFVVWASSPRLFKCSFHALPTHASADAQSNTVEHYAHVLEYPCVAIEHTGRWLDRWCV